MQNLAHTGKCYFKEFKMEFQILNLDFVKDKSLSIAAVCYHPTSAKNKEVLFHFNTLNTKYPTDEQSAIAFIIMNLTIERLKLNKENLYRLSIKNKDVYFLSKL